MLEDKKGGSQSQTVKDRDERIRKNVEEHIDRFPRTESHYCKASSTKEWLSSDLTLQKMYAMFISESIDKPTLLTYRNVKKKMLHFTDQKKMSFQEGNETSKQNLKESYDMLNAIEKGKKKVREIKEIS